MSDDHHLIFEAMRASRLPESWRLPSLKRSASPLEVLAHTEAVAQKKDENTRQFQLLMYQVRELGIYKHVEVNMYGVDGNAFVIMGTVRNALRRAGAPDDHLAVFTGLAFSGSYEELLGICSEWVTIVHKAPRDYDSSAWSAFKKHKKGK